MKKFIIILLTIVMFITVVSPVLAEPPPTAGDYAHQAHGSHGLGHVNQNFNGIEDPPPWDSPPGLP
jgi:hypothetical protein